MAHPILMPKPGQMTEQCTVVSWLKAEGDPVAKGDILFEIETDKSNMDVESFHDGVLLRIVVAAGETAPVNSVCGYVGQPGEVIPDTALPVAVGDAGGGRTPGEPGAGAPAGATSLRTEDAPAAPDGEQRPDAPAAHEAEATAKAAAGATATASAARSSGRSASPRAARLAAALGVDLRSVAGSGPGGRIVERDVRGHADGGAGRPAVTAAVPGVSAAVPGVSAAVRDEAGDALAEVLAAAGVTGTGPGRAITADDIRHAAAERPRPLSRMRQVIARRLTESWTTTPHFTVTVPVDVTGLIDIRAELKASGRVAYTVTDFIAHAVAQALAEYPALNSTTDGTTARWHEHVNLGLAVSLDDGLVVPVIRDADRLTLADLHARAASAAERARGGTLRVEELSGGTFTISNMGMLNVETFTAIINPGETGILAVSSASPIPVVRGSEVVVRQVMRMTLSADHRLVDGATGARFLNAVRARLEDTEAWRRLTSG
jgi:pyruvate dehydrogenase E2 component (dihydrolipoamide acetyltransferase)